MLGQTSSHPWATWPWVAAAVFLTSSIVVGAAEGRNRLSSDVLARSRGNNTMVKTMQTSCNLRDGNYPCSFQGDPCTTCDQQTFTDLTMGSSGGYKTDGTLSTCGRRWTGTCDASLNCSQSSVVGICTAPLAILPQ